MSIEVRNIHKRFNEHIALDDVSLDFPEGELVALLGPSGCGKTTLLRMLAGFEIPSSGEIVIDGQLMEGVNPNKRPVNMVFQSYAVFPHMDVERNVGYGLRVVGVPEAIKRLEAIVHPPLVKLAQFGKRMPSQLSGGQRQRVALARALVKRPKVLLLDEPLSALDAKLREAMQLELVRLQKTVGITFVIVTHDPDEALEVADRVVVMNTGAIEQVGVPMEIYDKPATPFVYQFIGNVNRVPCVIAGGAARLGTLAIPLNGAHVPDGTHATVFFRPHDLKLAPAGSASGISATVRHISVLGANVRIDLAADDDLPLEAELPRVQFDELTLKHGDKVVVAPNDPKIFPGTAPAPAASGP